jgi:hypothetical protein
MLRKNKGDSLLEPILFLGFLGCLIVILVHSCTADKDPVQSEAIKDKVVNSAEK